MGKIKEEAARGKKCRTLHRMYYNSPIGKLCLEDDGEALTALYPAGALQHNQEPAACRESELLQNASRELEEYFSGTRELFDIPLHPQGTDFQKKVWNALREIPFGETRSYADIAGRIGQPHACRAVGGANNKNRILIMIPCHRVIGKDGSMTGFGCGIHAKEYLLKLERMPARTSEKTEAQDEEQMDMLSEAKLI